MCYSSKKSTRMGCFSVSNGNNCVRIGDSFFLIRNILAPVDSHEHFLLVERFTSTADFFLYPLPSHDLGIQEVSVLAGCFEVHSLQEVKFKCVVLPFRTKFVAIPLTRKQL